MFHDIPPHIRQRMKQLEDRDARDRIDGTLHQKRLRQIPPETGKFLALLAASAPPGYIIEIGTSAGYSTMWLSLACRAQGRKLLTFELLAEKAVLAEETFRRTNIGDVVQLIVGDARQFLPRYSEIAFCFLDADKEVYTDCYDIVVPKLVPGGMLIADNAISHQEELQPFLGQALRDTRLDTLVLPIGKGVLICRKI